MTDPQKLIDRVRRLNADADEWGLDRSYATVTLAQLATFAPRLADALEAVLALHMPVPISAEREAYLYPGARGNAAEFECHHCRVQHPCQTRRTVTEALGGDA